MSENKKPTIHQKKIVASSRLFTVEQMDLEFANGEKRQYERLIRKGQGAVLVVPMMNNDTVLMIREYSGGTERYELGLPKGKVETGEDILKAANREMMEEVGYQAAQLTVLKVLTIAPQYMQHSTHIVLAQQLSPRRMPGDEPEVLEVIPWKLSNLEALIARADLTEARSIAALYMTRDFMFGQMSASGEKV